MIVALELDRDVDLALFSRYLTQLRLPHRISEDGDQQIVWVRDEMTAERVRDLFRQLASGELHLTEQPRPEGEAPPKPPPYLLVQAKRAPVTVLLLLTTLAFYPVTFGTGQGDFSALFHAMTFTPFEISGQYIRFADLAQVMDAGEYWRLLSPMFLHFGILHIAFNSLWVWEVGRRIEIVNGVFMLLTVTVVSSLSANVLQFTMEGPSLFGGMSGVVFGYLGFAFVWSRLVPRKNMGLPVGVYIFMFVFLALGFFGVFDFLLPGSLANGAHLGGLLAGLALGAAAALLETKNGRKNGTDPFS